MAKDSLHILIILFRQHLYSTGNETEMMMERFGRKGEAVKPLNEINDDIFLSSLRGFNFMTVCGDYIVCDNCGMEFERGFPNKHCSNCFVCTGCEVYYCPSCDKEIVITPVKKIRPADKNDENLF
jgi:hypothetical protein